MNAPASKEPSSVVTRTWLLEIETSPEAPKLAGDKKVNGDAAAHAKPEPDNEMINLPSGGRALTGLREMVMVTP
jgi:hypothetical protein